MPRTNETVATRFILRIDRNGCVLVSSDFDDEGYDKKIKIRGTKAQYELRKY